jgi:hypothetical protein
LPEGNWTVQYQFEDRAGNVSQTSPSTPVRIVSPQSQTDQQELDGDGIVFAEEKGFFDLNNDGIDDADQRDVATLQMSTGQNVAIDATVQAPVFSNLLDDPSFNAGGYLKVEMQIDSIQNRAVSSGEILSASLGSTQTVTNISDVLEFRMYPQIVRTGLVDESQVDLLAAQVINQTVGQIHRIDLRLREGEYNTYFKVNANIQTVWAFTWDAVSGTGAIFSDSNGNGLIDTVSLFIRDGGRGDDDGTADGVILDPGFVAMSAPNPEISFSSASVTPDNVVNAQEASALTISGATSTVGAGQSVTLTLTDTEQNSVSVQITTDAQGAWTSPVLDLTTLVDGDIQVSVAVTNSYGATATNQLSFALDRTPAKVPPIDDQSKNNSNNIDRDKKQKLGIHEGVEFIDFKALGFDARELDTPAAGWTSLKGELPKPAASLLSPNSGWMKRVGGHRAWDAGPSTSQNWMDAGEDWGPALPVSDWFTPEPAVTRADGFPVVVTRLSEGRIGVLRGQTDQTVPVGETSIVLIAPDAFGHVSAEAQVALSLSLADGQALPAWARFNGQTGQLLVQPPDNAQQELELHLTAMDQDGEKVTTTFLLKIKPKLSAPEGRMSFSEKMRQSASVTLSAALFNLGTPLRHG